MEYKVKQLQPTHAAHISHFKDSYIDEMLLKETVACQRKYDGERILIHFNGDEVYMTSRRHSKKNNGYFTEVQENFPCFSNLRLILDNKDAFPKAILNTQKLDLNHQTPFGYTVLDGELYADIPDGKGGMKNDWSSIVSIIHSLKDRATDLQKNQNVHVKYAVFDCLFIDGLDIRDCPYVDRYNAGSMLVNAISKIADNMHMVENEFVSSPEALYECRDRHIALGQEGIVVKSMQRKYYDDGMYIKAKRFETVDLVVYGYDKGNGKYADTVGALKCGYYDPTDTKKIVHVTDVNCGTDKDRAEWKKGLDDCSRFWGVIEVKCQEITKTSLRHPVYVRYREDKSFTMCTKDTIFSDKDN